MCTMDLMKHCARNACNRGQTPNVRDLANLAHSLIWSLAPHSGIRDAEKAVAEFKKKPSAFASEK